MRCEAKALGELERALAGYRGRWPSTRDRGATAQRPGRSSSVPRRRLFKAKVKTTTYTGEREGGMAGGAAFASGCADRGATGAGGFGRCGANDTGGRRKMRARFRIWLSGSSRPNGNPLQELELKPPDERDQKANDRNHPPAVSREVCEWERWNALLPVRKFEERWRR